jgi:serine/threonine-protein kinase
VPYSSTVFFGKNEMNETAPDSQRIPKTSISGAEGPVRTDGSSSRQTVRPVGESPTIITSRSPIVPPTASESIYRILEGRVMPGDRLGHFELVDFVGGGGMGRVFRALDTQLGRTVAVKILSPEQASDPDTLQRFQNEAQSSARLDHDNIARAFYLGEDRGLHFIVFEFIEGANIRELVQQKGPLPLAEAVSYTLQVAEALAHADARSVVHRDIKPSNVLITPEGRVKLIDMGLARMRHADPAAADLTASGVTLGTFDYISPEQARDPRSADIRSDIYSLGCTFFFMLAGQPPFPDGTVLQKLLQHQGDQPPNIQEIRPDLPDELGRMLRKMMAKDPRNRYADPNDLVTDLLLLADQLGLQPMSPVSRIWLAPQESSRSFLHWHLPWMAPVAALLCIVVLLDQYWSRSVQHDEQQTSPSVEVVARSTQQPVLLPKEKSAPASLHLKTDDERAVDNPPSRQPSTATVKTPDLYNSLLPTDGFNNIIIPPSHPKKTEHLVLDTVTRTGIAELAGGLERETKDERREPDSMVRNEASFPAPPPPSPATSSSTKSSGLLVVSEKPVGKKQYSTLAAACSAARSGDIIELRYDGPREERPLKLSNTRLTIQAGEGYRPVVVFRPSDADPVTYPRCMFSLAGGQLTIVDVAMELHIPRRVAADHWSLIETMGGEMVRLEQCTFTVLNTSNQGTTYHQDVAFLRVRSASDLVASISGSQTATPLATVELTDCIARGEADFLRVEDLQPVHLTWDNGLLLTTEHFLVAESGQTAPKLDEMMRIELHNLTADMRGGLCRLTSTTSNPYQLTVQVVATNSILRTPSDVPLILQEGAATVDNFRQRFIWNGNRIFYEGIDTFWAVHGNLDPETASDVMGFDAWKSYWGPSRENEPSRDPLYWKHSPNSNQPMHARGPADYTLEDPTFGDNAAGVPGCLGDRLPPLPPETESSSADPPDAARQMHDSWGETEG